MVMGLKYVYFLSFCDTFRICLRYHLLRVKKGLYKSWVCGHPDNLLLYCDA